MTKYVLCDWENNFYDDSDFVLMYYDDVSNSLHHYEYDTTRFGGCYCKNIVTPEFGQASGFHLHKTDIFPAEYLLFPTPEIVEKARIILEEKLFNQLVLADKARVDSPEVSEVSVGTRLRTLVTVRNQVTEKKPCDRCNGLGKWVNPRNEHDMRTCFSCHGTGEKRGEKKKNNNGKIIYNTIPAGTCGEVVGTKSFGAFYQNGGYNQPNRFNTSVKLKLEDGSVISAGLDKCQLERDYADPDELRQTARRMSFNYEFQFAEKIRCAWLTHNFALHAVRNDLHPM